MGRVKKWGARVCRRLAQRWDPVALAPFDPEAVPIGAVTFEVRRDDGTRKWNLYTGPSGAKARDRFLHVKRHKEVGTMELLMDGVVRDRYEATG